MQKQTIFMITVAILLSTTVSIILYNVKAANAQGNMSTASGANMTKGNMTAAVAVKNMTSAMSSVGKAIV
jgi:hypothetical protein